MADLIGIAKEILRKQKKEINTASIENMKVELESCRTGRKVQALIILEHNDRVTSNGLKDLMGIMNPNLSVYTKRLERNFLIEIYDETRFKKPAEANFKPRYHSILPLGRELIADLGK
jgi:hypothetical protein